MTTRQDIEEAIETARYAKQGMSIDRESLVCFQKLIRVAEAWLKLEDYINSPVHVGTWESLCVDEKMKELLNPKTQTDLQKVREFAAGRAKLGYGAIPIDQLLNILDQFENKVKPMQTEK